METADAIKVIQTLADGIDPVTGEILPESSAHNHPKVIRALFISLTSLQGQQTKEKRERQLPANSGKCWSAEDDRILCAEFDQGVPVKDLASRYLRTGGAIASRLLRLGKVSERRDAYARAQTGT